MTTAYVCTGKDCRRDVGHKELKAALDGVSHVKAVRCQDLCHGPVAGIAVHGEIEWFEKVRKKRHRRALIELLTGKREHVPDVLADRWAKKRHGKVKR